MIDRPERDLVAEALRHFITGQLSNFNFENQFSDSNDPAIVAIEDTIWCFYDDFIEHKLSGKWQLPPEWKAAAARWILFLYSDYEYQWPKISHPGIRPKHYGWVVRLLGQINRLEQRQQAFIDSGEFAYWPFISKVSFLDAKSKPKLLSAARIDNTGPPLD